MQNNRSKDPSRYLSFYSEMGGHNFTHQGELDDFCKIVEHTLNKALQDNLAEYETAVSRFGPGSSQSEQDEDLPYKDKIRSICMPEEAATRCIMKLQLLDELRFISIYRSIEIARAKLLISSFDWINSENCHQISYLRKSVPFWSHVFGVAEIDEIRVINNCIKHSGKVSRQLSQMHPSWQEGQSFHEYRNFGSIHLPSRPLRDAYERLAPYVGAYWIHFCELTTLHSPQRVRRAERVLTEDSLLELIRSGKDIQAFLDEDL